MLTRKSKLNLNDDFLSKTHTVTEARVTSISSLLSILGNLTPLQLPYNALT